MLGRKIYRIVSPRLNAFAGGHGRRGVDLTKMAWGNGNMGENQNKPILETSLRRIYLPFSFRILGRGRRVLGILRVIKRVFWNGSAHGVLFCKLSISARGCITVYSFRRCL